MPTLRAMIDGKTMEAVGAPKKPSPAAKSVSEKVTDPFGEVKDGVDELNEAQLRYEQAKSKAAMSWMPVKKVSDALDQQHGLGLNSPDANMGYQDPNAVPQPQIDPMTGQPMPMPMPGQSPFGAQNLANKMQPPGGAGKMPGSAPPPGIPGNPAGPAQSATPNKMGVPQPGGGVPNPGMPGQGGANPQGKAPGSSPTSPATGTGGSKKPGTGGSGGKSAGKGKGGSVKVEVHAERNNSPSHTNLATAMATSALRSCDMKSEMMEEGPAVGSLSESNKLRLNAKKKLNGSKSKIR